jgi:hypothetical protein
MASAALSRNISEFSTVHSEQELPGIGLELIYSLNQEISVDLNMSRVALVKDDSIITMSRSQVVREKSLFVAKALIAAPCGAAPSFFSPPPFSPDFIQFHLNSLSLIFPYTMAKSKPSISFDDIIKSGNPTPNPSTMRNLTLCALRSPEEAA